jgi:peptide chain release factor subunit 1
MIRQALEQGAVGRLLISEGLRKNLITLECGSCNNEWIASVGRMEALPDCPSCKASGDAAKELKNVSLIDELAVLAAKSNTEIVYISIDTEEGSQLLLGFGGLAGICRYPMM